MHPQTAIIYMKIGKILLDMGENYQAYSALRNASDILEVVLGVEHSVYKNLLAPALQIATELNEEAVAAAKAMAAREAASKPPPAPEGEEAEA